ncbi:unnamed protein product [Rotaria sordida]|uniref:Uncharacterized protein n=1 Tax=Rotaria sordida TaxID=392033 RepID=A0A815TFZ5_9BILA|nr:unnamed protein product [Rotaria sordida]
MADFDSYAAGSFVSNVCAGLVGESAVINTIQEHKIKTPDIGGASTPPQFVECVLNEIVKMTPTIGFSYEMQKPNLDLRYKTVD